MIFYTIAASTNQNLFNELPYFYYTESGCYTVDISFKMHIPVYTQLI